MTLTKAEQERRRLNPPRVGRPPKVRGHRPRHSYEAEPGRTDLCDCCGQPHGGPENIFWIYGINPDGEFAGMYMLCHPCCHNGHRKRMKLRPGWKWLPADKKRTAHRRAYDRRYYQEVRRTRRERAS